MSFDPRAETKQTNGVCLKTTKEGVNIAKAKLKLLKKRQEWIEQGVYFGTDKELYFENMMKILEQR